VEPETWGRVLIITGLFAAVFWPNLRRLWLKTNPFTGEPNWSHAVVVPIIGLYYLFVHREDLIRAGSRQFLWGPILRKSRLLAGLTMLILGGGFYAMCQTHGPLLASMLHSSVIFSIASSVAEAVGILGALVVLLDWSLGWTLFGLGVFVYGIYPGQNDYLKDLGMVITLFGIVLMLNGPAVMKIAWFPVAFLICAIPWPGLVYSWVAEPLQTMAASVAVHVLDMTGVNSVVSGTKIVIYNANPSLPPRMLNVAEACAGMRSLMTFVAVGGAIAFLSSRPLWQKLIIVVSAVPIAIFCNVMRISGQGLLDHYVSPQWSESFAHQFVGMIMLLPAFFLILGVGYLLDKLFIEEADDGDAGLGPVASASSVASPGIVVRASAAPASSPAVTPAVMPTAPALPPTTKPAMPMPAVRPEAKPVSVAPVVTIPKPAVAAVSPAPAQVAPKAAPAVTPPSPRATPPAVGAPARAGFVPPRQAVQPNAMQKPALNAIPNPAQPRQPVQSAPATPRPAVGPGAVRRVPPSQPNAAKPRDPQRDQK
jgi:exosortase